MGVTFTSVARGPATPPSAAATAELSALDTIVHSLAWQCAAFLGLACHVLLVREGGVALAGLGVVFLALLYARLPLAGLGVFLQVLLHQNLFVGVFSNGMEPFAFLVLQGTAFLAAAALGTIAAARILWCGRGRADRRVAGLARLTCVVIALAAAYTVAGALSAPPASAAVYFRATVSMLLALLVGLDVGRVWGFRTVAVGFLVALAFGLALTAWEVLAPLAYYEATGAVPFMNLKYGPANEDWPLYTAQDLVSIRTQVLFNVTASESTETSFRFGGPNLHPVSYAYVLAVAGAAAVSLGWSWLLLLVVPLLVSVGVKGSLTLLVMSLGLHFLWRSAGSARLLLAAGLLLVASYVAFGLLFGLERGDFHVIGFLGGVNGFLKNPLGHGIGAGGNLSADTKAGVNWQELQNSGADFALESAVGVMLYQMGIGTLAVFWVFFAVLRAARPAGAPLRPSAPRRTDVVFIALAMVAVNGIFQEEAYSPYALGLLSLFCGVLVSNGERPAAEDDDRPFPPRSRRDQEDARASA